MSRHKYNKACLNVNYTTHPYVHKLLKYTNQHTQKPSNLHVWLGCSSVCTRMCQISALTICIIQSCIFTPFESIAKYLLASVPYIFIGFVNTQTAFFYLWLVVIYEKNTIFYRKGERVQLSNKRCYCDIRPDYRNQVYTPT
jgi:hypothetical protein